MKLALSPFLKKAVFMNKYFHHVVPINHDTVCEHEEEAEEEEEQQQFPHMYMYITIRGQV